jgi:hypothetical protein
MYKALAGDGTNGEGLGAVGLNGNASGDAGGNDSKKFKSKNKQRRWV